MSITKKRTLIILDWDDTLFPTSWVMDNYIDLTDPSVRTKINIHFKELDMLLYRILCKMSKLGKIIIITNAMPEWVHLSGSMLRETNGILKKIDIVSARKDNQGKVNMKDWKKVSFYKVFVRHNDKYDTNNIVSIGDALYEHHALVNLYQRQDNYLDRYLKSIKLQKNPSYDVLHDQLKILNKEIKNICLHEHHLDLEFTPKR